MTISTLFSLFNYLFTYSFTYLRTFFYRDKNSEATKARNLKFGDMINLYMKLRTYIFGGFT